MVPINKINNMDLENRLNFNFMLTLRTTELFHKKINRFIGNAPLEIDFHIFKSSSNSSNWKSNAVHDIKPLIILVYLQSLRVL